MLLIQALLVNQDDLAIRVRIRSLMETSGLRRILDKHAVFDHAHLIRAINDYYEDAKNDELDIADQLKDEVLMNFSDPRGICDAIVANTDGRALDFFGATMKQLLLVPQEPELRLRTFQLVEKLVASVVTDRKGLDGDFSSLLGSSVESIVARFGDQDRLEAALEEAENSKAVVLRMQREKDEYEEEIAARDDGIVGQLKSRVDDLQRALTTSRGASEALKAEIVINARSYAERMAQSEQEREVAYKMLQESKAFESLRDEQGVLDRGEVLAMMAKKHERTKAIQRLEGTPSLLLGVDVGGARERTTRLQDVSADLIRQNIEASLAADSTVLVRCFVAEQESRLMIVFRSRRQEQVVQLRLRRTRRTCGPVAVTAALLAAKTRTSIRRHKLPALPSSLTLRPSPRRSTSSHHRLRASRPWRSRSISPLSPSSSALRMPRGTATRTSAKLAKAGAPTRSKAVRRSPARPPSPPRSPPPTPTLRCNPRPAIRWTLSSRRARRYP